MEICTLLRLEMSFHRTMQLLVIQSGLRKLCKRTSIRVKFWCRQKLGELKKWNVKKIIKVSNSFHRFYVQESLYIYEPVRLNRCYKIIAFKDTAQVNHHQYEAFFHFDQMQKKMEKESDQTSMSTNNCDLSYDFFTTDSSFHTKENFSRKLKVWSFLFFTS